MIVRRLEHLAGTRNAPALSFAVETRDRPGPAHKAGAFPDDVVWVQLQGGLFVAKARVQICWIGEYSNINEVRGRTRGSQLAALKAFWVGRPRYGYAAVATLKNEGWIDPFWGGPRTYGYEWILLDDDKKRKTWLDRKDAPRAGDGLRASFLRWRAGS